MEATDILDIGREAIFLLLKISAPMMLVAMVVGLTISLFQALTQIQEMTLTFVPKILVTMLALVLLIPFIASNLSTFSMGLFQQIARV